MPIKNDIINSYLNNNIIKLNITIPNYSNITLYLNEAYNNVTLGMR